MKPICTDGNDFEALRKAGQTYVESNFDEHLHVHAEKMRLAYADYRTELKRWFNGYRFAQENPVTVYNPVSIALTLATPKSSFRAFWAATGRASPSSTPMSR